jgi:hypothetical protein
VKRLACAALLLALSCKEKPAEKPAEKPKPAEPFKPLVTEAPDGGTLSEREAIFQVGPFTPAGPAVPEGLTRLELNGDVAVPSPLPARVLLVPMDETYLAQVNELLAALDDAGAEVWLAHPDGPFAYKVKLRDEAAWQEWIDEAVPGKLRVIQRSDGFELQTNMGKLPGGDPNGPSVPVRGGKMDLPLLRKGFQRVKQRFKDAPDVCFAPTMGLAVGDTVRAFAADYPSADEPIFPELCYVYPRPKARDAGR